MHRGWDRRRFRGSHPFSSELDAKGRDEMDCAIGIDIGTTNSKVVLCGLETLDVVHMVKFPSPKKSLGTFVDFDLESLEKSLTTALRECAAYADGPILFLSIASVGESGVLFHADGSHDPTSIVWYDKRGEGYALAMHADGFARRAYASTGIPAHPNYGLFKLLWMKDQGVDLSGCRWVPLGDYVAWWLCGELYQDESLASRTFALDLEAGEPAREGLAHVGLSEELFLPLMESGIPRGTIRPELANEVGLDERCEVCVAGHDHMAGSIACGLDPEHELLNSTGTSEGILTINSKPVLTTESFDKRLSNGRYVREGLYSYYASVPTAGFALEWIQKLFDIDADTYFGQIPETLKRRYENDEFDGRALVFIPHLRGSGPPRRNIEARACMYGMRDGTTREDVLFSIYLGLVMELRLLYLNMVTRGELEAKVIGPAIKSPLWMQLKADALGIRVSACNVDETVARGAVMLAAQKRGISVAAKYETKQFIPDQERHEKLVAFYNNRYLPASQMLANMESDSDC